MAYDSTIRQREGGIPKKHIGEVMGVRRWTTLACDKNQFWREIKIFVSYHHIGYQVQDLKQRCEGDLVHHIGVLSWQRRISSGGLGGSPISRVCVPEKKRKLKGKRGLP